MDILTTIGDAISGVFDTLLDILPTTPVHSLSLGIGQQYLGWLNWFVPFDLCMPIFLAWLGVLGATIIIRAVLSYFGFLG